MNFFRCLMLSAIVLTAAGCATSPQGWLDEPLKDTTWQLMTIEANTGNAGREYVANKAKVVMTLRASGDAEFTLGCEKGSSDWRAGWERIKEQGQIFFDEMQIAAAPTPCEPDLVVQRFLRDFEFLQSYVLIQNHLYLNTQANETTYGWRKVQSP